ncbi:MAG: DegT/DnrJ/EryC1/StrS family aminotransferase [Planctomycetota bacterium]|nr:MAG: DegT/DnrJ/EryC1/StrS family aminotransferase [Planctomycetota bacterium]
MQPVPFVDLRRGYLAHREAIDRAVARVLETQSFVLGPAVERLEREIAALVGCEHAVGVGSGTDALVLALLALGIGPGDEVLTTPWSFFATASAIARTGATPVFVDIDPATFCLDVERAAQLVRARARVRAVLPVHLYGRVPDLGPLLEAARERGVAVVEDAAQAIGASGPPGRAGAIGTLGCFSFYPTKNLGGAGDGGMVTTNDDALAERLRSLRWHGTEPPRSYHHTALGLCSRLGGLSAAVLSAKLERFESAQAARRAHVEAYREAFADLRWLVLPELPEGHGLHQFTLRVLEGRRDALREHLQARGIGCAVFYPLPLHRQPALAGRCVVPESGLAEAERAAGEVLQLPIFPELTADERGRVIDAVRAFDAG